jgi:hypothetical protein
VISEIPGEFQFEPDGSFGAGGAHSS